MSNTDTTTTTLVAADFARTTSDAHRNEWTRGQLDAVVAALAGAQVIVVADKATGFALLGTLERTTDGAPSNAHGALRVVTAHGTTDYRIPSIGAITVMPGQPQADRVRWDASDRYRAMQMAGVRAAQAYANANGFTDLLTYTGTPYGGGRVGWAITSMVAQPDGTRRERQVAYGTVHNVAPEVTPAP